ncbi:MAG: gamma carbonic anhydrase family protein [Alphaproteobacteria bacterium]
MTNLYSIEDERGILAPKIDDECFLAPNVHIIGDVTIKKGANIWFGAVLRGDVEPIVIGENSNVQDNCVIHTDLGFPCHVGNNVTVGHAAILHGCTIEDGSLIGMGATILNNTVIGKNSLVGAGALVTENTQVEEASLIVGSPAKVIRKLKPENIEAMHQNTARYLQKGQSFRKNLKKI